MLPGSMSHPTCPSLPPPPPLLLTSPQNRCWYRLRLIIPVSLFLLLLCPPHHETDVGSVYVASYLSLSSSSSAHLIMVLMLAASTSHLTCPSVWMLAASTSHLTCPSVWMLAASTSQLTCPSVWMLAASLPLFLLLLYPPNHDADVGTVYVSSYLSLSSSSSSSSSTSFSHLITMLMLKLMNASKFHPTCHYLLHPSSLPTSSRYGCCQGLCLILPVPLFLLLLLR